MTFPQDRTQRVRVRSARRRSVRLGAVGMLSAVLAAAAAAAVPATVVVPTSFALAATPPMGFNGWNAYGCDVSARLVEQTADAMLRNGMAAAGYTYVNLDDCWMAPTRDADGDLVADPSTFPDGIAALAAYVHARGLKLGIYADAGTTTCAGLPGSLGHEEQDAATFAAWQVDYVKYDRCNIPFTELASELGTRPGDHDVADQRLYARFAAALAATGRPIVLSVCTGVDQSSDPAAWAPAFAQLWRTTPDIEPTFGSLVATTRLNSRTAVAAGPGHWNDPDMLEIGNGMTAAEDRAEMSLWAVMAAPLLVGTDLTHASAATLQTLTNPAVVAVDQDPLGRQGRLVEDRAGLMTVVRPLADGDRAVVLLNTTVVPVRMTAGAELLGLPSRTTVTATELWSQTSGSTGYDVSGVVPAHGALMYRVRVDPPISAPSVRP